MSGEISVAKLQAWAVAAAYEQIACGWAFDAGMREAERQMDAVRGIESGAPAPREG